MANRYFYEFLSMFEKRPVIIWGNVSIGATGAPTLNANSRGIKSVVRTGVGAYTITLEDGYTKLLNICCRIISATGTDAAVNMLVAADNSAAAPPTITVTFNVAAGTATELSNGAKLLFEIKLRNSSAPV